MLITPSFKKSLIVEQFQGNYLNCRNFSGSSIKSGIALVHEAILLTRSQAKILKKLKSFFELFFARVYSEIPVTVF